MKASVIIPAHNEEQWIARTLEALRKQEFADFEIIVVDNVSTDKTAEVMRKFTASHTQVSPSHPHLLNVRLVHEEQKGTLWACERGRKEATGEVIVRIDADCLPSVDWLTRGCAHFNDADIVGVSGPYDYFDGGWFFRYFTLFFQTYIYKGVHRILRWTRHGAVMIGGNSFMRATALEKVGGFNTDFVFYGDDTHTGKQLSLHGKMIFDHRLVMKTSARRFKSQGTFRTTLAYLYHFFKIILKP